MAKPKKPKPKIIKQPRAKDIQLTPRQQALLHGLFVWERSSLETIGGREITRKELA